MKNIDGRPCKITDGVASKLNSAFAVLEIPVVCKQTEKMLVIGDVKINAVRSYTTTRAIEFDHKVHDAIRLVLDENGLKTQNIYDAHKLISQEIEEVSPSGKLGEYGNIVNMQSLEKFLAQAQAIKEIYERPVTQKWLKLYDAVQTLFKNDYDEVL